MMTTLPFKDSFTCWLLVFVEISMQTRLAAGPASSQGRLRPWGKDQLAIDRYPDDIDHVETRKLRYFVAVAGELPPVRFSPLERGRAAQRGGAGGSK
jgi:hypothetical protein